MIRTLIVEDDPMVMQINERFLEKVEGFVHVGSVSDLDSARVMIHSLKPDLILLDIFFSVGKGIDIIQWLRSENIDADVIFITADRNPKTIERAFRFGAVDYLIKPFRFDRFEEALEKFKKLTQTYKSSENLDQVDIDRMSQTRTSSHEMDKTRSVSDERNQTVVDILDLLNRHNSTGYTAQEVADALGISRITARRYLDDMENEGKLELYLEYGKIGRPRNKYRINIRKDEVDF